MKTTKSCKVCGKEMPKGLNNVCSNKCQKEKDKAKRYAVKLKKSVSVSFLGKKADKLWSEAIRLQGACEYCGKKDNLNAHHIFGRNNKSVRWEIMNGICLCAGCHTFSSVFSAHKTPSEFTYWLESKKGREWMDLLQEMSHTPMKVTPDYLLEQIAFFKILLDN